MRGTAARRRAIRSSAFAISACRSPPRRARRASRSSSRSVRPARRARSSGSRVADIHPKDTGVASRSVSCPVLVERDDELRALAAAAGAAADGARCVVVSGEAGTGKSRLLREFAARLPASWTVRSERAGAALPPVAAERPLGLVLGHDERLDPAALATLPIPGVLVVLGFRLPAAAPERRALAALVREPRVVELRLAPLSPAGLDRMAAAMGRYAPDDLYRRTGGNPFWAEEVLSAGERLPWTLVEAIALRLDALSPLAAELAAALAVADDGVPPGALARLGEGWRELADAGLVTGDRLRHALVGGAIRAN